MEVAIGKLPLGFKYQWKVSPVVFGTLKQQIITMLWNHLCPLMNNQRLSTYVFPHLCLGSQCTYTIMGTVNAKSYVHSDGNGKPAFRIEIINEIITCGHVVAKLLVTEYRCSWLVLSFRNRYSCSSSDCP